MTSSKSKQAAKTERPSTLLHPRSHDYVGLIRRWRKAAPQAGLKMTVFGESGGFPVYHLRSRHPAIRAPRILLSAGIHGDESASTEAALAWIERHAGAARDLDLHIFPCLNPWGLVHNKRTDERDRDLNRCYRDDDVPHIRRQKELIAEHRFDLAVILHEDYDAQGVYLYETSAGKPHWGEHLVAAMACHIPADPRKNIDGIRACGGVMRRRITADLMPDWPEAFVLHFLKTRRVFTIETPSEFNLDDRVEAHCAAINAALALAWNRGHGLSP